MAIRECGRRRRVTSILQNLQEFAETVVDFERVAQVAIEGDAVVVAATNSIVIEGPAFFEVMDDSLNSTLGDPDLVSDLSLSDVGIAMYCDQHVGVVCQELPRPRIVI